MSRTTIADSERPPLDLAASNDASAEEFVVSLVLRAGGEGSGLPTASEMEERARQGAAPLSYDEFTRQYGASDDDVAKVRDFAQAHGLSVGTVDRTSAVVDVAGSVDRLANAFNVDLKKLVGDNGEFLHHTSPASVPSELAGIVGFAFGLSGQPTQRGRASLHHRPTTDDDTTPQATPSYTTSRLAEIYDFPPLDGSGQVAGIIELAGGYQLSDIKAYLDELGLPMPTIVNVGPNERSQDFVSNLEVTMDLAIVASLAPKSTVVVYNANSKDYSFSDYYEIFRTAVFDRVNKPKVLSNSWSWPEVEGIKPNPAERKQFEELFIKAALLGITICSSSGDSGSLVTNLKGRILARTSFPVTSPMILGCGGTTLLAKDDDVHETVWNSMAETLVIEESEGSQGSNANGMSTGGGVSRDVALPRFQSEARVPPQVTRKWVDGVLTPPVTFAGRGVPDVAANADLNTGYKYIYEGQAVTGGGTSASAPLWTGLFTRINQGLERPCGYVTPLLYHFQTEVTDGPSVFRPIDRGSNGAYEAHPGDRWNPCTGLGVPIGTRLLAALREHHDAHPILTSSDPSTDNQTTSENTTMSDGKAKQTFTYLSGHDWGRIMAHAWRDADFKAKLEADPTTTLRAYISETWPDREYTNLFQIHDKPADIAEDQVHQMADSDGLAYHCSDLC
ncbi:MAG: protease pro-enzyme activation domain-containing protein [Myxococcota bacterium]